MNAVKFGKNMKKVEKEIKRTLSERQFKIFKGLNDYIDSQVEKIDGYPATLSVKQADYLKENWTKIDETIHKVPRYKEGSKEMQDAFKKIMRLIDERFKYIADHPLLYFKWDNDGTFTLEYAIKTLKDGTCEKIEVINKDKDDELIATWDLNEAIMMRDNLDYESLQVIISNKILKTKAD